MREVETMQSILSDAEIEYLKKDAESEWLDFYADEKVVTNLFKKLAKPLQNLCNKRISFLATYDSMYSPEDIIQHANEEILIRLRNNDYIPNDPNRLIGWALKCADNAIHNLREKAMTQGRSSIITVPVDDWNYDEEISVPKIRLRSVHANLSIHHGGDSDFTETGVTYESFNNGLLCETLDVVEDDVCFKELLGHADPKINTYLRTICYGEHNTDFWTWFYYHEPHLAQRAAYVAENPEAIGPYLQRHLKLSTHQLTKFLKQHLPGVLERVSNTPARKAMLAYAG